MKRRKQLLFAFLMATLSVNAQRKDRRNHGVGSSDHFLYIFWLLENMLLSLHSLIKNNKYQNDQENRPCDFLVQSLEKTRRNVVLRAALSYGAGIRQLSRLTGISFGVIQKLTK